MIKIIKNKYIVSFIRLIYIIIFLSLIVILLPFHNNFVKVDYQKVKKNRLEYLICKDLFKYTSEFMEKNTLNDFKQFIKNKKKHIKNNSKYNLEKIDYEIINNFMERLLNKDFSGEYVSNITFDLNFLDKKINKSAIKKISYVPDKINIYFYIEKSKSELPSIIIYFTDIDGNFILNNKGDILSCGY